LSFEIFFWYHLGQGRMAAELESDLRFDINREFKAAKISIPYPQRDLHLVQGEALRVEVAGAPRREI
jgi:potassium efflux system protein